MSVSLIIEEVDGKKLDQLIPIATQETFDKQWLPIVKNENLEWLLLFESGSLFTQEDIPYIIDELNKFSKALANNTPIEDRVQTLVSALNKLKGKKVSIYIG